MSSQTCIANCGSENIGVIPQLFTTLFSTLLTAQCGICPSGQWIGDYSTDQSFLASLKFDFIVIGSGAAGPVVANRLSENKNVTVLIIEAGGDPPAESCLLPLWSTFSKTTYDWDYSASTAEGCGTEHECKIVRGKCVGGSTTINGAYYSRGSACNYDKWENDGAAGWGYDNVLPYFKKSEGNKQIRRDETQYHNANGPMQVNYLQDISPTLRIFLNASEELGLIRNYDFNGHTELGCGDFQFMSRNGMRESSATAFLNPVKDRPNLYMLKNSLATKINFEKINGIQVARSVEIDINKKIYTATARKEIILSAGVIESPKLLLLSGIGPKEDLKAFGIKVIKDLLGCGKNLIDHMNFLIAFEAGKNVTQPANPTDNIYNLFVNKKGPYILTEAVASFQSTSGTNCPDNEAIYFVFPKGSSADLTGLLSLLGVEIDLFKEVFRINKNKDVMIAFIYMLQDLSRGWIKLNTTSPYDKPLINMNYFSVKSDLDKSAKVLKQQSMLEQTETFKKIPAKLIDLKLEPCEDFKYRSDDYWKCYAKLISASGMHQAGSCKMGKATSENSVVDERLRVIGVQKLRVSDASIMPSPVSGHLTAPTVMIGEKCADMIKEDWDL